MVSESIEHPSKSLLTPGEQEQFYLMALEDIARQIAERELARADITRALKELRHQGTRSI